MPVAEEFQQDIDHNGLRKDQLRRFIGFCDVRQNPQDQQKADPSQIRANPKEKRTGVFGIDFAVVVFHDIRRDPQIADVSLGVHIIMASKPASQRMVRNVLFHYKCVAEQGIGAQVGVFFELSGIDRIERLVSVVKAELQKFKIGIHVHKGPDHEWRYKEQVFDAL